MPRPTFVMPALIQGRSRCHGRNTRVARFQTRARDDLAQMSRELGQEQRFGELIESSGAACEFGRLGTAVFRSEEHRIQIWFLSDGKDIITVTHIAPPEPDPDEVRDVRQIVQTLTLAESKPKWKFW